MSVPGTASSSDAKSGRGRDNGGESLKKVTMERICSSIDAIRKDVNRHEKFHLRDQRIQSRMSLRLCGSGLAKESPTEILMETIQKAVFKLTAVQLIEHDLAAYYRCGKDRGTIVLRFLSGAPGSRRNMIVEKYDKAKAQKHKIYLNFHQSSLDFFLKRECLKLVDQGKIKHAFVAKNSLTTIICNDDSIRTVKEHADLKQLSNGKVQKSPSAVLPARFRNMDISTPDDTTMITDEDEKNGENGKKD